MKLQFRLLDAQIASNCFLGERRKHTKPTVAILPSESTCNTVLYLSNRVPADLTQGLQLMGMIFDSSLQKKEIRHLLYSDLEIKNSDRPLKKMPKDA